MTDNIKEAAALYKWDNHELYTASEREALLTGFIDGATSEAAREYWDGQGWVRVEDGLPEDLENVLGTHTLAGGVNMVYYSYEDKRWFDCDDKRYDEIILITHWRPLPAPPNL